MVRSTAQNPEEYLADLAHYQAARGSSRATRVKRATRAGNAG